MKSSITLDIFDENGASLGKKKFYTTYSKQQNLNQWLKHSGALANIDSIHRAAIDRANARRYDKVK